LHNPHANFIFILAPLKRVSRGRARLLTGTSGDGLISLYNKYGVLSSAIGLPGNRYRLNVEVSAAGHRQAWRMRNKAIGRIRVGPSLNKKARVIPGFFIVLTGLYMPVLNNYCVDHTSFANVAAPVYPPMTHILLLYTTHPKASLGLKSAAGAASFHVMPSLLFHTSL
jgi:hypothetical protein